MSDETLQFLGNNILVPGPRNDVEQIASHNRKYQKFCFEGEENNGD